MDEAFQLLEEHTPVYVRIRLIVAQGHPISWFRTWMFKIGVWFINRSTLHVGERKDVFTWRN
jgi:hypothetical protein